MKKTAVLGGLVVLITLSVAAKEFWTKPFTEWDKAETMKMLTDSPWADHVTFTRQIHGLGSGIGGEKEFYDSYTVRFFSALPVRHAYVRMLQLMNRYHEMTPDQKGIFDARFQNALTMDTSRTIVISLEFESNDRELAMNVQRTLAQQTAPQLRQKAYLISDRLGRVELKEYYAPPPDGTGAKFVFPRAVDGEPVVSPQDKHVRFEFQVPGPLQDGDRRLVDHRIYREWKVKKMIYQGELTL